MIAAPPHVVFDCNIYLQALLNPDGPAGECFEAVSEAKIILFSCDYILFELEAVCTRPKFIRKYTEVTPAHLKRFVDKFRSIALFREPPVSTFPYLRDPNDAVYLNLARAASAAYLVSRYKDLLSLANASTPEGQAFAADHPALTILDPVHLLQRLATA